MGTAPSSPNGPPPASRQLVVNVRNMRGRGQPHMRRRGSEPNRTGLRGRGPAIYPEVNIQKTKVVKNPVNLRKKSLRLVQDTETPSLYFVEFTFDSETRAEIILYFGCREVIESNAQIPKFEAPPGRKTPIMSAPAGMNQNFQSLRECSIDVSTCDAQQLEYKEGSGVYPLILQLNPVGSEDSVVQCQLTYASICNSLSNSYQPNWILRILKQKVIYGNKSFEIQEIYGIGRSGDPDQSCVFEEDDGLSSGRECVICLAEEKDTAVLPCRHMCLCRECAEVMKVQSNKCPICRQPVRSLLQISVKD